ncbi:MAG: hypothetical protein EPN93_03100 [Spirochaetes bacterium]|nr:MAG: hypothetical protein EPN93_03100 [Spirochaetota bacterium]
MKEYIASLRWLDFFYFTLTEPRKLADLVRREGREALILCAIGLALVAMADTLSASLLAGQSAFFFTKITYGWILGYLLLCLEALLLGLFIDGACQFAGHQGSIRTVITLVGFSLFPRTLLLPAVFVFRVFGFAPVFFYGLFSLGLVAWAAVIVVQGLSESHEITSSRATFIVAAPFVAGLVFMVLVSVVGVMTVAGYIAAL